MSELNFGAQIRHSGRVRGGRLLPGLLGDGTRSDKERTSGLWDNSYRFPGMEIAIEEVESMKSSERKNFSWLSDGTAI
jgi:hypothetical protein